MSSATNLSAECSLGYGSARSELLRKSECKLHTLFGKLMRQLIGPFGETVVMWCNTSWSKTESKDTFNTKLTL